MVHDRGRGALSAANGSPAKVATGAPQASAPAQGPPSCSGGASLACAGGVPPRQRSAEREGLSAAAPSLPAQAGLDGNEERPSLADAPRREAPQGELHVGLARPSFSTSAFSRVKVSCANFLYAAVLMYMGTMS